MIEELAAHYQQEGIHALNFRCPHRQDCSKDSETFVEAKGAFVGTEYEKGTLPRLAFISLDPGSSDSNPNRRTVEFVRYKEEHECDISQLKKSRHWYRTHELAMILLRRTKPDLRIEDSHLYFAHVNSVKCCVSNDNHASASHILFENCRKYIGGEVVILKPDILVTQGKWAMVAVEKTFEIVRSVEEGQICSHKWVRVGDREVLWFHTNHPRNFGIFNRQRRECFEKWSEIIYNTSFRT